LGKIKIGHLEKEPKKLLKTHLDRPKKAREGNGPRKQGKARQNCKLEKQQRRNTPNLASLS